MSAPPSHHAGTRFRNPWTNSHDHPSRLRSAAWLLSFPFRSRPAGEPAPWRSLDPEHIRHPAGASRESARIAWLGHSSFLIQTAGQNILTDPVFAERASPLSFAGPKREVPLPLDPADLPAIDVVLLSHDHYDHLDLDALAFLHERDEPLFAVPLRLPSRFGAPLADARIVELDWYGMYLHEGLRLHCTPAKHFSARGLHDRDTTLWCSWFIEPEHGGARVYYGGDSGYAPHFAEIASRVGTPDVAILPIGAYAPRWFMERVHVDPAQALDAWRDMGGGAPGTHFVAGHWGTFQLTDEPLDEPPKLLAQEVASRGLDASRVHVLPVGGVM